MEISWLDRANKLTEIEDVKSRLSAYGKKQSNGVVSKIDELISLLKGNGGTVEVRTI